MRTRYAYNEKTYPGLADAITLNLKANEDPEEALDDAIEEFVELLHRAAEQAVDLYLPKYKILKKGPTSEESFYVDGGQVHVTYPRTIVYGNTYTVPFENMLAEVQRKVRFTFKQTPEFFQDVFKIVTQAYKLGVSKSDLEPTHPDVKEKIVSRLTDMDAVSHDTSYDDEDGDGGLHYFIDISLWLLPPPTIKFAPAPKGMKVDHAYEFQVKVEIGD